MSTVERRSGYDRREHPPIRGRVVYSRGWIIVTLQALAVITAIIAATALVLTVSNQASQIQQLQQERRAARYDACQLLRQIVHVATPPKREAQATAFIKKTPLHNCRRYALTYP